MMTSDKAKKIKAIVKGTAPKSTFGTNPNDPWSAKYNVAESNDLDRYLKSRGINPAFVGKDTKIAHSKSGDFAKWKRDHQFEEVQSEQIATTRHTPTEIRQHELKKRVHKHNEIGAVKAEAWDQPDYEQSIKARQAEADKKAKEQSKEGVNKLLTKYRERNKKEHHVEEVELDENKIGELSAEIGHHLDKHIDDYKTHGGAEHLGHKTVDTAKKLVKSHGLHPTHAQKFVNDYVEKRLAESRSPWYSGSSDVLGDPNAVEKHKEAEAEKDAEESKKKPMTVHVTHRDTGKVLHKFKSTGGYYGDTRHAQSKGYDPEGEHQLKWHRENYNVCPVCGCTPCNCTHIFEDKFGKKSPSLEEIANKHKVSMEEIKKAHEEGVKIESEHTDDKEIASEIARDHLNEKPDYYKKIKQCVEDVFQDSQAATQTAFDMGTSPDDTVQRRQRQLSKSARMVKALYKKHKMSEDIYDAEKEDKSVATYGKKPKMTKNDNDVSGEPDAVAVMSGGKTLTGEPRDDVEIDPMMKTRPNGNDLDKKKDKQ